MNSKARVGGREREGGQRKEERKREGRHTEKRRERRGEREEERGREGGSYCQLSAVLDVLAEDPNFE